MTTLAHKCLLELLKHQKFDHDNPVLNDQVFDVQMHRIENDRAIKSFQRKVTKLKKKVHSMSSLRPIKLETTKTNKIMSKLSNELFDVFSWKKVRNPQQTSWKEYFHNLYDLIVSDYDSDHPSNLILAREVVKYHNVLEEPVPIDYSDKLYPIITGIQDLFHQLKHEQVVIANNLSDLKSTIRSFSKETTDMQHTIITYQSAIRKLEKENEVYQEILRWSIR